MIQEIILRDFPWDEIPWARSNPGINALRITMPPPLDQEAQVLILRKNNRPVAYLVYSVWSNAGYIEIHYLQSDISYQKKGYATELMNWVCSKYSSNYEMRLYRTSGVADTLLKKWGFENTTGLKWVRKRQ